MYLRFRNSRQLSTLRKDDAFEEIYRKIHGRLPKQSRPCNKPSFKVQIYLVRSEWINGKPKQIYIGAVGNVKIHLDKNKKIILNDEIWKDIQEELVRYGVLLEKQDTLLKKIKDYFVALEESLGN